MLSTQELPDPFSGDKQLRHLELGEAERHRQLTSEEIEEINLLDELEETQPTPYAVSYFTKGVNAPKVDSRESAGFDLRVIRLRLFGNTSRNRATAARLYARHRHPAACTVPQRTDRRTHVRSRERRDGSRRHSTRGGTDDSDGEPEPPGEPAERLCACGCGRDIRHKRRDSRTFDSSCRMRVLRQQRELEQTLADERDSEQRLAYRAVQPNCRCNGHHLLGDAGDCVKCGRPYRDDIPPYYLRLWERIDHARAPGDVLWALHSNGVRAPRRRLASSSAWRTRATVVA